MKTYQSIVKEWCEDNEIRHISIKSIQDFFLRFYLNQLKKHNQKLIKQYYAKNKCPYCDLAWDLTINTN